MGRQMTREALERMVFRYIDAFTTMTLACCMQQKPWAADVFYARQGFDLIFFSSPSSRHSAVFAANSLAAATIHGDYRGWKEIKGLQMEGQVERVTGARARARSLTTYLKRHPFVREFFSDAEAVSLDVARKMAGVDLYAFRPLNILYVDNSAGFGTRWKLQIQDGKTVGDPVLI
jgi:uncharacterized protein